MSAGGSSRAASVADRFDALTPVADAVLYEGYLLYPYRRSSIKNRGCRWQFGVLLPRSAVAPAARDDRSVAGSTESWFQQTECLLEPAPDGVITVRVRFLQLQRRSVLAARGEGGFEPLAQLNTASGVQVGFDEAVPREFDVDFDWHDLLDSARALAVCFDGVESIEPIRDGTAEVGRVERQSWPLTASLFVTLGRANAPFPLLRLGIRIENSCDDLPDGAPRDDALTRALLGTHVMAHAGAGSFVSLLDPPEWAASAAAQCGNVHTFPVLGGEPGDRDLVLSSPIILYDHPKVAPESPGDLFDATEIDEILSLRTMTLSDDEKREARATDARAAALVDRVDSLAPDKMARLHGVLRSRRPIGSETNPQTASVAVCGGDVTAGSLVRLRPRSHGTDAHDMFLVGRTARVAGVFIDLDDERQVAVTIENDPAAEFNEWYGRYRYFAPDELELLTGAGDPA